MYTHNDFRASARLRKHTAAINVKRASVFDLISQATSNLENSKNGPPLIWQGETKFQMLVGLGQWVHSTLIF